MTVAPVAAALVVGVILLGSAWHFATRSGRPWLPLILMLAAGIAWAPANKPVEGPTIVTLRPGDGLTYADLLLPLVVAGAFVLRFLRTRRSHPLTPPPTRAGPATSPSPTIPRQRDGQAAATRHRRERRRRTREHARR